MKSAVISCLLLVLLGFGTALADPPPRDKAKGHEAQAAKPAQLVVRVYVFDRSGKLVGPVESPKVTHSTAEWKRRLSPDQFQILRSKGTEQPFCGTLLDNHKEGVYTCAGCGLPLFSSDSKFHSGTGWPSFFQPIAEGNIAQHADHSHGMDRTEIKCARCGGHLGHVFDDGPKPTGLRFCLNSESLNFTTSDKLATLADPITDKLAENAATDKKPTADDRESTRSKDKAR